ncbi:MAG TPA: hypothetical protein PLT75_18580 [Spirochaetota bacterium]|nr:hypothetical protein [Spirochaetota bacterium]
MKKLSVFLVVAVFFAISCGGGTQYRDASQDEGSREFGPREVKTTVAKMVGSMYEFLKTDPKFKRGTYIMVRKFRNRTSEHIDTSMVTNEITTNLIKKRIRFLDSSLDRDTMEEMEKGMTGMIDPDSAIPAGHMKSPNLWLTGDIRDNVRRVGSERIQYLVVTLKLLEAKSRITVWQEQQEFLKASRATRVTF